jgi:uncharacterized membrane protein YgaE (UPF0421/DUF939 family)
LKGFAKVYKQLGKLVGVVLGEEGSSELKKLYDKLYEVINHTAKSLYSYSSENEDFLKEKYDIITQNL